MWESAELVHRVVRGRRTVKVLGDPQSPRRFPAETLRRCDQRVRRCVADAGWAPFHYDRKFQGVAEPWRFCLVWNAACQRLARELADASSPSRNVGKVPNLLAGCGALVLATWLPQQDSVEGKATLQQVNDEHLAATAAAVQNLLLLLTAHHLGSYWSSGGVLADSQVSSRLGIAPGQRLLAAIFIDYPDGSGALERIEGKLRSHRSPFRRWTTEPRL